MKENISILKRNKKVLSLVQFGSSLKKNHYRDIDLCIFTSRKLTLKEKLKVIREFPEKYDISFYDDLPLNLKKEVLTKGKIVFTRNYLQFLKELVYIDLEYPRYQSFLKEYHQKRVVAL